MEEGRIFYRLHMSLRLPTHRWISNGEKEYTSITERDTYFAPSMDMDLRMDLDHLYLDQLLLRLDLDLSLALLRAMDHKGMGLEHYELGKHLYLYL